MSVTYVRTNVGAEVSHSGTTRVTRTSSGWSGYSTSFMVPVGPDDQDGNGTFPDLTGQEFYGTTLGDYINGQADDEAECIVVSQSLPVAWSAAVQSQLDWLNANSFDGTPYDYPAAIDYVSRRLGSGAWVDFSERLIGGGYQWKGDDPPTYLQTFGAHRAQASRVATYPWPFLPFTNSYLAQALTRDHQIVYEDTSGFGTLEAGYGGVVGRFDAIDITATTLREIRIHWDATNFWDLYSFPQPPVGTYIDYSWTIHIIPVADVYLDTDRPPPPVESGLSIYGLSMDLTALGGVRQVYNQGFNSEVLRLRSRDDDGAFADAPLSFAGRTPEILCLSDGRLWVIRESGGQILAKSSDDDGGSWA